jgi:hypothetical protein
MKNPKNKRAVIMAIILVGLLILAYKVMFVSSDEDASVVDENISASARVESILQQVESINFDTSIMQDGKFQSLKSIETPLVSLPVGKKNPFSDASN